MMTARDAATPPTAGAASRIPGARGPLTALHALRSAWRHPLERNALALMTGTVATALVGVLFWTAAAHYYPAAEVGRGSAVISTAAFLGNLSHLNLGNVYARFLPAAGGRTPVLVQRGMLATAALALVLGTGFVLLWQTGDLFASTTEKILFPLCVAVLMLFTLEDPLLVGLHAATWIPGKNFCFAIAKLALLVLFAGVMPTSGLVAAWVVPAAIAVVVVIGLLYRRLIPGHVARYATTEGLPPSRELVAYAGAELATGLMIYIVPMMLPLIVVALLGDEANAYFAIPYVISSAMTMLTWNVAVSFVVEAASDEAHTTALTRRSLRLGLLVAGVGTVALLAGAPLVLSIFGDAYAQHGSLLLRLMALAAPATVITTVYTSVLRVRRQVRGIVIIQVLVGTTVIALSTILIGRFGVTGVGIAYLAAEGVAGAALLVPLLRSLRYPKEPVDGARNAPSRPAPPTVRPPERTAIAMLPRQNSPAAFDGLEALDGLGPATVGRAAQQDRSPGAASPGSDDV